MRYLSSAQGKNVRDLLGEQLLSGLERLQDESWEIVRQGRFNSAVNMNELGRILTTLATSPSLSRESPQLTAGLLNRISDAAVNLIIESENLPVSSIESKDTTALATTSASLSAPSPPSTSSIAAIKKLARIVRASNLNVEKSTALLKRVRCYSNEYS